MIGLEISQTMQPFVALAILSVMFVMFVRETFPMEVVAISGAAAMLVLGLLPVKDAVAVKT